MPRNKGSIIIFLCKHTHTHTHTPLHTLAREERLCSVWAENIAAVPSAVTLCVCSSHTIMTNKGLLRGSAVSSCQRSIHAQGCSCLSSTLIHCAALTHCSAHPLAYYSLCFLAERKESTTKCPRSHWAFEGERTEQHKPKEQQGMSSDCHSPRDTWLRDILPQALRYSVLEEGGVVLPGSCTSSAESSLVT